MNFKREDILIENLKNLNQPVIVESIPIEIREEKKKIEKPKIKPKLPQENEYDKKK